MVSGAKDEPIQNLINGFNGVREHGLNIEPIPKTRRLMFDNLDGTETTLYFEDMDNDNDLLEIMGMASSHMV